MSFSLKSLLIGAAAAAALATASLAPAPAVAMTVQPVVIDLSVSGRNMSQVISVQNTFQNPLTVEIRIEELAFDQSGAHGTGKDPGDLLVFPPQAIIKPGETQAFRVQWVGDPDLKQSKSYFVTVAQLPVQLPKEESAIQILYNFQVLVSVSPAGGKPQIHVTSAGIAKDPKGQPIPVLTVENPSNTHGYLANGRLRIVEKDASGHEVFNRVLPGPEIQQTIGFGLIGAGQTRKVYVPIKLPSAEGSVEAQFTPESRR